MRVWSFRYGCAHLKFGMGVSTVQDLVVWSPALMVDFPHWLSCDLSNILGHACLQLLVLANHLDHCPTYGVVGLMRVFSCFMQPCGGCLYLSWLDELMETIAICAPWLSFTNLPYSELGASKLSCDS